MNAVALMLLGIEKMPPAPPVIRAQECAPIEDLRVEVEDIVCRAEDPMSATEVQSEVSSVETVCRVAKALQWGVREGRLWCVMLPVDGTNIMRRHWTAAKN